MQNENSFEDEYDDNANKIELKNRDFSGNLAKAKEFIKRNKPISFLECSFDNANFSDMVFKNEIEFKDCIFYKSADFSNTTFNKDASFENSTFNGYSQFKNSKFKKNLNFKNVFFDRIFDFRESRQNNPEYHGKNLQRPTKMIFDKATFKGIAYFSGRAFAEETSFIHTNFLNSFYFDDATIGNKSNLNEINMDGYENIQNIETCIDHLKNLSKNAGILSLVKKLEKIEEEISNYFINSHNINYNYIEANDETKYLSRTDTARIIDSTYKSMETWAGANSKELPYIDLGKRKGYKLADIKRYMQKNPPHMKLTNDTLIKEVMEIAIPYDKIVSSNQTKNILDAIKLMSENGFTHLPVVKDDILLGVFSEYTFMKQMAQNWIDNKMASNTNLEEFRTYIDISENSEIFLFVKANHPIWKAKQMFLNSLNKEKRLGAIFITNNGKQDGKLLGMLTSWDIAGI
ncbi:MAG: pentapeptide repeat-containing protein [Alphaproteobacteria bacterium]|nr:pentapeptide repeat-containing protein [Alphaproteobacteria bacterium]